jgi:Uma2 family endonuclease
MLQKIIKNIALYGLAMLFIIAGLYYAQQKKENIKENWNVTKAKIIQAEEREVVKTESRKERRRRQRSQFEEDPPTEIRCDYRLTYSFNGQSYQKHGTAHEDCDFKSGNKTKIYVNPKNPDEYWFEGAKLNL